MMNKLINLLLIFIISTNIAYAQDEFKEIETLFFKGTKKIENVKYYVIKDNNAYLLKKVGNKIILKSNYIINNEKELTILAIYKKNKIEFKIDYLDIFYFKINKMTLKDKLYLKPFKFKIKYLFNRVYSVNISSDYEEIVKQSKKKYTFIEIPAQ